MPPAIVARPVWRRFRPRYLALAAAHVRAGGHAAIVRADERIDLLLPVEEMEKGRITELGKWALLSIEQQRWRRVKDGRARGLATARVREAYEGSVLDWCARDSVHGGATRVIELDCLECAACCHDSNVLLDDDDLGRWRDAGRADLAGRAYVRRARDGKVTLRFVPKESPHGDGIPCQHLQGDRRCGIYTLRPDSCRVFVVGSEACLSAREDTLGIRDGDAAAW